MAADLMTLRREVVPTDVVAVREITESTGFFSQPEIEMAASLVEARLATGIQSGYHFLFAEREGRVAGFACFGPIACTAASYDLYWIAVHSASQRVGMGRFLLEESERAIWEMGGWRVYVETSSRAQYEPTRRFYQRCGYVEEAILTDFYAPGDSKIVFVKILPDRG
jgi:GNAT superfamily N-acetyltransferase